MKSGNKRIKIKDLERKNLKDLENILMKNWKEFNDFVVDDGVRRNQKETYALIRKYVGTE